jgi:hypothetical protein
MNRPLMQPEIPDLNERGAPRPDGTPQVGTERLFMQLQVFTGAADTSALIAQLKKQDIDSVLYADVADPRGVGLLTWSGDPGYFVERVRPMLLEGAFGPLALRPEFGMFGRTYSLGYEADLQEWLFNKPRKTALNPDWPWAVWYPLRRRGSFAALPADQQRTILMEHSKVGMNFVAGDFVHDIRLACHGLDQADNDFVIGLVGKELYPLSKVVEAMRKTTQTSQYLEKLGPFFVGKAVHQSGI